MKTRLLVGALFLLSASSAQALDFGVGVKTGTVGTGVDLSVALTQTLNARVSLTSISYDFTEELEIDDDENQATIDAEMDLDFGATALLLDWYVFDGTFHVTAGFMKNDSTIDLTGNLVGSQVTFNNQVYDVNDFVDGDAINGSISAGESFEPYLGIGWGRKADDDPGLSLSVELGVVLMSPEVELDAPTLDPTTPGYDPQDQADLEANVKEAEDTANDEVSVLEAWPILSIGLNYAF